LSDLEDQLGLQTASRQQLEPQAEPSATRFATILITSLALFAFLPFLGSYGIIDPSDGLYAEGAREMVQSGNYLTPQFDFAPFYEKPILIYWLISASYKLFGVSELAARLPIALSGVITVLAIYFLVTKYLGKRGAALCALVVLSNPLFLVVGHLALTDMPLTCLVTIAMLSFFHASELRIATSRINSKLFAYLGYALMALTVLLKGPIMLVIVTITLGVHHIILRVFDTNRLDPHEGKLTYARTLLQYQPAAGILIMAAIASPWFLIESYATKGAFIQEFFFRQNLGRLGGTVNHTEQFWFYIPIVLGAFIPWTFVSPYAIPFIKRLLRRGKSFTSRQRLLILCLSWMVVNYSIFSAIKTKLPTYILPAVPLTCVFIGAILDTYLRKFQFARMRTNVLDNKDSRSIPNRTIALVSTWCAVIAVAVPVAIIHVYNGKFASLRSIVESAPESNMSTFWRDTTSGIFYHQKKITVVFTIADLKSYLKTPEKPHMMIVTRDLIPFLKLEMNNANLFPIREKGDFCLFNLDEPGQRKI
jgi:4-amino-4-deoxy-L-arabinose transferase-like glycosyltransferase